jgi:WD40 repeat protein
VTRKNAPVPERKQRWQEAHRLAHNGEVTALAVHGDQAATSETIGDVRLWDMQTGGLIETVREVKPGDSGIGQPVLLLRLSKGDVLHILFETERTQSLMRVDRTEGGRRQTTVGVAGLTDLSDDGRTWALRRKDAPAEISLRRNLLTDSNPLEYQLVSEADKKAVTHTAISADDTRIATTTADAVRVYPRVRAEDLKGKQLRKEDWHKKPTREFALPKGVKLTALKLSDDGKRLALIGEKGFARVFDADAGKELCELKGHDGTVNAVAFTPDGSQVATANGKVVRVFDAKSGKLLGEIKGHDDEVTCLAFAADGKRLVTGSKDKMAKVWELK